MIPTAEQIIGSLQLIVPEAILLGTACLLFLAAAFVDGSRAVAALRQLAGAATIAALLAAGVAWMAADSVAAAGPGPFRLDGLAWLAKGMVLFAGLPLLLIAWNQVSEDHVAESHACLLIILAGASLTAAANDLIGLFLALELVSIPTYVFLYLPRRDAAAQEAVLKYFLLSVFSSAVVLFGFSYLYGATGTTSLPAIEAAIQNSAAAANPAALRVGLGAVVAGLCFRIAAVPFHFYAPDVFQGLTASNASLLSFVPKVVGFAALLRIVAPLLSGDTPASPGSLEFQLGGVLWILAVLTMFAGNVLALLQTDLMRLMAWSSVAHTGYMLIGMAAGQQAGSAVSGTEALLFYLAAYGAMSLGVFAAVSCLGRTRRIASIHDLAGLAQSRPGTAFLLAVFLFSLTGLPPTAGFLGKLNLFWAAWAEGTPSFRVLAVALAVNAGIAAWYYLRIVAVMYLDSPPSEGDVRSTDRPALLGAVLCGLATVGLFLDPSRLWSLIERLTI